MIAARVERIVLADMQGAGGAVRPSPNARAPVAALMRGTLGE